MVVENVLIETDPAGDGRFRTGTVAPEDKWTKYDFVIVAEKVETHAFGEGDRINRVAKNRWEGHVEDRAGAVGLEFEGMKSLDIEKCPDSETDIRFLTNGKDKGKRKKFKIEPVMDRPAPLALVRVYILSAKPRLLPHQKVLIVHKPLPGPLSVSPVREGVVE